MKLLHWMGGILGTVILMAGCSSSPENNRAGAANDRDGRRLTVYVLADTWTPFAEKMLLAQASAYADWTDFSRDPAGSLLLSPRNGTTGRILGRTDLGEGLWEVRLEKKILEGEASRSLKVTFLREQTGGVPPSLYAIQKALKGESRGQVRVSLMNAWADGRFEALVEIR